MRDLSCRHQKRYIYADEDILELEMMHAFTVCNNRVWFWNSINFNIGGCNLYCM